MEEVNGHHRSFKCCVLVVRFGRLFYSTHGSVSPLKMSLRRCTLFTTTCHTKCVSWLVESLRYIQIGQGVVVAML